MTQPTPFRFLDLPAEIRNHIYELASTPEAPCTISHSQPSGIFEPSPSRPFRGLTQVCRKIRTEFLPLYRASVHERVKLTEAIDYVTTFLRVGDVGVEGAEARYEGEVYFAHTYYQMDVYVADSVQARAELRRDCLRALWDLFWEHEELSCQFQEEEEDEEDSLWHHTFCALQR